MLISFFVFETDFLIQKITKKVYLINKKAFFTTFYAFFIKKWSLYSKILKKNYIY